WAAGLASTCAPCKNWPATARRFSRPATHTGGFTTWPALSRNCRASCPTVGRTPRPKPCGRPAPRGPASWRPASRFRVARWRLWEALVDSRQQLRYNHKALKLQRFPQKNKAPGVFAPLVGALVFKTSGGFEQSSLWVRFPYTPVNPYVAKSYDKKQVA